MFTSTLIALSLVFPALGAPYVQPGKSCDISNAKLILPPGVNLPPPTEPPTHITVGVGTQNYTCSEQGTYTSIGAVAAILDISCLYGTPRFDDIQDVVLAAWQNSDSTTAHELSSELTLLGEHFFITNPITGTGISPEWDFTATLGNTDAFVVANETGTSPAPTGSQDVAWLSLVRILGELAKEVYRTDTRAGQPPASCTPGSEPITVQYSAKYWFFGGGL
ncbi:uncharacterized protein EV420DRAFT_1479407 [Desarmillaria tabescens]|uniref:Malate dehydrogenase n=1 Tax=Armillaria tabescens TaxID=1929756 RepID=A0AA39KDB0_ARMTA|nr:uncharacterized protein EV420DRAFT_1479407 [Desarmillaria tabescens]KAK0458708.1 hypothetical protein EV420DRAFT_1479407 [Desarmillaria tabescens]